MAIPANAARNPDGSLANRAAWGITDGGPGGVGAQPGSYDPANAPAVDWNALAASGYGGLYNGMESGERDRLIANSRNNFQRTGVVDSNLSGYLNNRDTARGMGLVGATGELDMNALFGGRGDVQNLEFGPGGDRVQYQSSGANANTNMGKLMGAMGGGSYNNLGDRMQGFNNTPTYGMFGNQSSLGMQETLLRNGLNGGMNMLNVANRVENPTTARNPISNRFAQGNFNYNGGPAGAQTDPGAGGGTAGAGAGAAGGPMPTMPQNQMNGAAMSQYLQQMNQWAAANRGGGGQAPGAPAGSPGTSAPPTAVNTSGWDPQMQANIRNSGTNIQGPAPGQAAGSPGPSAPPPEAPAPAPAPSGPTNNNWRSYTAPGLQNSGDGANSGMRGGGGGTNYTGGTPGGGIGGSGRTSANNSGSLSGLGSLYNTLQSGQGLGATGSGRPAGRRANNSMWGY